MGKTTFKQKRFIQEYIKNKGNGTQAALKTYDVKSPEVARSIASENLTKPDVKHELDTLLQREELSLHRFTNKLSDIAGAEPIKGYSGADILEAIKTGLKLHGVLTEKRQTTTLQVTTELSSLSKYDLIQRHKKITQETQDILEGEEV